MTKRKILIIAIAALAVIGIVLGWYFVSGKSTNKCVAPNDAIVDCELLRQNPTKTDWPGDK
jgi:uncharacterized protein YneF (UPF0154 family)